MTIPPLKDQLKTSNQNVHDALLAWAQSEYSENTDSPDFLVEVFLADLMHYCDEKGYSFMNSLVIAAGFHKDIIKALDCQRTREDYFAMFQTGDRIEASKGLNRVVRARILSVEYENATYRATVLREDTGRLDCFIWNIYQDEISVKKLEGEMSLVEFQALLESQYKDGYTAGFNEAYKDAYKKGFAAGEKKANDLACQNGYKPEEK